MMQQSRTAVLLPSRCLDVFRHSALAMLGARELESDHRSMKCPSGTAQHNRYDRAEALKHLSTLLTIT